MVDSSGSITDSRSGGVDNWSRLLNAMNILIDFFNIGPNDVQVGVIQFSTTAQLVFDLRRYQDKGSLRTAINSIQPTQGITNTQEALRILRTEGFTSGRGDRAGARNVAIVITDGVSNVNPENTLPEAERAQAANIDIFSIGITDDIDIKEIQGISSRPKLQNQNWFTHPTFDGLESILRFVYEGLQRSCEPTPQPPSTTVNKTNLIFIINYSVRYLNWKYTTSNHIEYITI